ncbi:hypothetical protein HDU85_001701 [Gaertneriomyces sp. JEL0708]|nr:hypothetical protein HDU85_001701 [Gaertneriomyces sp. JEL0708]
MVPTVVEQPIYPREESVPHLDWERLWFPVHTVRLPSVVFAFDTVFHYDMGAGYGGNSIFRVLVLPNEDDMFHQRLMALAKSSQLRRNLSTKAFNQPAWRRLTSLRALRLGRDEKSAALDPEAPPTPVKTEAYNGTVFHIETPDTDEMEVNWYLSKRGAQIDKNVKRIFVISIGVTGLITLCVQCTTKVHTIWPKVAWLGECPYGWEFVPAWLGLALFFFVLGPRALWTTRHIVDPHRVRLDLILVQSIGLLAVLVGGCWWGLWLSKTGIQDYSAGNVFLSCVPVIVQVASVLLPTLRARENDQRRRRQHLLMNYTSFDQVLNDPVMRTELKVFTIRDSCVEAIIFYEEYDKLQRIARTAVQAQFNEEMRTQAEGSGITGTLRRMGSMLPINKSHVSSSKELYESGSNGDPDHGQQAKSSLAARKWAGESQTLSMNNLIAAAKVPGEVRPLFIGFYEMFIRPDAPLVVNVSYETVQECLEKVKKNELTVGMFDKVKEEVFRNLYLNVFSKFLLHMRAEGFYLPPKTPGVADTDTGK